MQSLTLIFAFVTILIAALAALVVWSRRGFFIKLLTCILALAIIPGAYYAMEDLLGRPKPVDPKSFVQDITVLGALPIPDVAIHVYVLDPGQTEPRAYVLPWSKEAAEQLQKAQRQAAANETDVKMNGGKGKFESSLDPDKPLFYAAPMQRGPDKDYTGEGQTIEVVPQGEAA